LSDLNRFGEISSNLTRFEDEKEGRAMVDGEWRFLTSFILLGQSNRFSSGFELLNYHSSHYLSDFKWFNRNTKQIGQVSV